MFSSRIAAVTSSPRVSASRCKALALILLIAGCSREEKPTPATANLPPDQVESVLPGAAVMLAAGDIAVCGKSGDEGTAALVERNLAGDSVRNVESVVATLGDNAYPSGSSGVDSDFPRCFGSSWGRPRIMKVIRPSPGNHDYDSGDLDPYFRFFGETAGAIGKGYYSYDVGNWHVVSLNSELYFEDPDPSHARAQEGWLRRDLAAHPALCTLAYFHRPRFSSGIYYPGTLEMQRLWKIMDSANVDLVVNGHEHHYERFLPQTPTGVVDTTRGMTEFIAGTGGGVLRKLHDPVLPNSAIRVGHHFGILKLALGAGEYRHAFIDTDGGVWDSGAGKCH
jgi:acid phosphatase type 7